MEVFKGLVDTVTKKLGLPFTDWRKTRLVQERVGGEKFGGRLLIKRDGLINNGVYLGEHQRGAIIVDDKEDPVILQILRKLEDEFRCSVNYKNNVLQKVFTTVKKHVPGDSQMTWEFLRNNGFINSDREIYLGTFVKRRIGWCTTQALLGGYLLEGLKKDGFIAGKVSIDRNDQPEGGHAWDRYKNSVGRVFILDYMTKGPVALDSLSPKDQWPYLRPEEKLLGLLRVALSKKGSK